MSEKPFQNPPLGVGQTQSNDSAHQTALANKLVGLSQEAAGQEHWGINPAADMDMGAKLDSARQSIRLSDCSAEEAEKVQEFFGKWYMRHRYDEAYRDWIFALADKQKAHRQEIARRVNPYR